jgi:hypothetical protein
MPMVEPALISMLKPASQPHGAVDPDVHVAGPDGDRGVCPRDFNSRIGDPHRPLRPEQLDPGIADAQLVETLGLCWIISVVATGRGAQRSSVVCSGTIVLVL